MHANTILPLQHMKNDSHAAWQTIISFIVRFVALPPLVALCAIGILHHRLGYFPGESYGVTLMCLSLLPFLPYPITWLIPSLRHRGRFIQRGMAVVFSVIGYVTGTAYCLLKGLHGIELAILLSYLFSGLIIALLSFLCHFKCSGHASGLAGPITLLGMPVSPVFFLGYALLIPVFISSLRLKRHTREELMAGALTPSLLLLLLVPLLG